MAVNNTYKPNTTLASAFNRLTNPSKGLVSTPQGAIGGSNLNNAIGNFNQTMAPKAPTGGIAGVNLDQAVSNLNRATSTPTMSPQGSAGVSGVASYKGIPITPGSQADIQAQMARIDGQINPSQSVPPSYQAQTQSFTPSSTQSQTATRGLFPSVLESLRSIGLQDSEDVRQARENLEKFRTDTSNTVAGIKSQVIPVEFQQGRAQVVQQAAAEREGALSNTLQSALDSQGQRIGALQQAGSLASPVQLPYSTQYIDPLTGQAIGGGASSGLSGGVPQGQASTYAQEVLSGQRSYDDAVAAMGLFGGVGKQALDQAIRAINPNFNFAQAQSLGNIQGEVGPSLNMAQKALENLTNTFNNTPQWQITPVPIINSLANALSQVGIGTGSATAKGNAINEARTQVASALGVMTNTTPTAWSAMVEEWFPNNATPAQLAAGIQQFEALAQSRQQIFGTPGAVSPFSGEGTGGSIWDF